MPIRMKDVAADLGLSVVTISKVLRNRPDISDGTRERVLKRVKELRYYPSATARSLVSGRSYLIGLLVPDLLHPFFAEIAVAVSKTIRKRGYSLIIVSSEEDRDLEEQEIEQMVARRLDGLIIAASVRSTAILDRLEEQKEPFVLIDRSFQGHPANFVGIDDKAAGRIATQHLIQGGCRRIAHIGGRDTSTSIDRLAGYKQALQQAGLPFHEQFVVACDKADIDTRRQGATAAQRLLAIRPTPDGVFCFNDPMAIGAMETFLAAGLTIPGDIAIVGCGNLHYDNLLSVPLSSIDQQSALIGRHSGNLILDLVESNETRPPKTVVLKPRLIIRASSNLIGPG